MKLLFLSNVYPTPANPTRGTFNAELVRALRERGHHVQCVVPVPWTTRWQTRGHAGDVPDPHATYQTYWYPPGAFRASYHRWMWWSIRGALAGAVRQQSPDAVIGFWIHPDGTCAVRLASNLGIPSVLIAGGSDLLVVTGNRARAAVIGQTLKAASVVLAEGAHLVAKAIALGANAGDTHNFRRGVDAARFFPGSVREARDRLGIPQGRSVILYVGNLVSVKGVDVLLAAFRQYLHSAGYLLLFVGDGQLRERMERDAATWAHGAVRFVGRIPHEALREWYHAADVLVLPSRSEGTPNVLQEATACGVPFVASDVGAVRDLSGPADRVVPAEDTSALGEAIQAVLRTPGERHGKLPSSTPWDGALDQLERLIEKGLGRS